MDFEVDMLKFWVEQLQELLPDPTDEPEDEENLDHDGFPRQYR